MKLEIKIRNELTQKHLAHECAEWIRTHNVSFKSASCDISSSYLLTSTNDGETACYMPFPQFATMQLGTGKRARSPMGVGKNTGGIAKGFLHEFDELWNNPELVQDVTDAVVNGIEQMYRENASELILLHGAQSYLRPVPRRYDRRHPRQGFHWLSG